MTPSMAGLSDKPGTALGELIHSVRPYDPDSYPEELWELLPRLNCFVELRPGHAYEPLVSELCAKFGLSWNGRLTDVRYSADPDSPAREKRPYLDGGPKGYFHMLMTNSEDRAIAREAVALIHELIGKPSDFGFEGSVFFENMASVNIVKCDQIRFSDWRFCVCAWRRHYTMTEPGGVSFHEKRRLAQHGKLPPPNTGVYGRALVKRRLWERDISRDSFFPDILDYFKPRSKKSVLTTTPSHV